MKTLENDRFLRALLRQEVDRTPVWIMRQAGRYLPEYRKLRAEAGSFMDLATNPELACEVTLQPLRRFPLDAAILFSDILTIPDAMGLGLYFVTGEGPKFERPVRDAAAIAALAVPDPEERLSYVTDAVRKIRQELAGTVPLIGFSGSPWTLATYMVEGGSSRNFARTKALCYTDPRAAHELLDKLAQAVTAYLNAQIAAGAQAVQIFDSWGGALGFEAFQEFSLRYMAQIVDGLKREQDGQRVPVILFSKGCNTQLEALAATGADALGVDWTISLREARQRVGQQVALQGNLDPSVLLAPPARIRTEAERVLDSFGPGPGLVFNLGHGITPEVPPEHLGALIKHVQAYSARSTEP
ncbi:MAG: uroporphyrinogen decarboxylase [Xanthomonadales bacterium]|nr:uroporphyrinogen decarboxylase [Xanthomonadales bacterium]